MRGLEEQITRYAAYHRDRRNIATHFAGIPMIVFALVLALRVVRLPIESATLSLAVFAVSYAGCYYLMLDRVLGAAMAAALVGIFIAASSLIEYAGVRDTLIIAALLFVAGWALQFVGHYFEGMTPAFFDDIAGLIVGPLFIMTELFFALGLKPELRRYVESRVGPVVARRTRSPA